MADLIVTDPQLITDLGTPLKRRFHDSGDGTWAESIWTGGGGGGGGASTIADGADVTEGAIADAAVAAGAAGTLSAKLRRISTDIASMIKLEDAASASGDAGIFALGVRNDAQATLTSADADYSGMAVDLKGNVFVTGPVVSGATDSGNPIKIGGRLNTTRPTLTDGQRGDAQMDSRGNLAVAIFGSGSTTGASSTTAGADAVSNSTTTINVSTLPRLFNATTWDRNYSNFESTILASAVRTATTNGADQINFNGRGIMFLLGVTVEAATETLSLKIQAKDPIAGGYADYIDFGVVYNAATMAPGTFAAIAYPGLLTADLIAGAIGKSAPLPRTFRAVVTHSSSGSWTYSLASITIN